MLLYLEVYKTVISVTPLVSSVLVMYNYKDLSDEFISILKLKRDEIIYKLKLTSREETDILLNRVENLEKKIEKLQKKKKAKKARR